MMRVIIMISAIAVLCSASPLITKEFIDEVKQKATWKATEYEENVFKGIQNEDITDDTHEPLIFTQLRQPQSTIENTDINAPTNCSLTPQNMGDQCFGSSFAFAVAGMVSMRCCNATGKNEGWLSVMELISCDRDNYGCAGGWPATALKYVEQNGLVPNDCYPYNGQNEACPRVCRNGKNFTEPHKCKIKNIQTIRNLDDAKKALVNGPIIVSFEAYADLFTYKEGVYCHVTGGFKRVISATVVSFETVPKPHLKMMMPFGTSYGEGGFLRMCTTCCGMFTKYEKGNAVADIKS